MQATLSSFHESHSYHRASEELNPRKVRAAVRPLTGRRRPYCSVIVVDTLHTRRPTQVGLKGDVDNNPRFIKYVETSRHPPRRRRDYPRLGECELQTVHHHAGW